MPGYRMFGGYGPDAPHVSGVKTLSEVPPPPKKAYGSVIVFLIR